MIKKLTEKNKRTLNKLLGLSICPHCDCNLAEEENIGFCSDGHQTARVSLSSGSLNYEMDEFHPESNFNYYCRSCGEDLDLSEDDVIKILKVKKRT